MRQSIAIGVHVFYWLIMIVLLVIAMGSSLSQPPAPPGYTVNQTYPGGKDSSEQVKRDDSKTFWQKATDDPVAFFTLWLVFFTGVLAVSTIGLWLVGGTTARAARDSADIATKALIADTRAWMTPAQIDVLHLRIDEQNISVLAKFVSKNIGKSPALKVTVRPQLFMYEKWPPASPEEQAMQVYSRFQDGRDQLLGGAAFPEREVNINIDFSMSINDAMEQYRNFIKFNSSGSRDTGGQVAVSSEVFTFVIAGCVAYKTADSNEICATGFSYYIRRVGTPIKAINIREPRTIQGSEIEARNPGRKFCYLRTP
jgi:hypothetical protein